MLLFRSFENCGNLFWKYWLKKTNWINGSHLGTQPFALHFLFPESSNYTIDRWMHLRNFSVGDESASEKNIRTHTRTNRSSAKSKSSSYSNWQRFDCISLEDWRINQIRDIFQSLSIVLCTFIGLRQIILVILVLATKKPPVRQCMQKLQVPALHAQNRNRMTTGVVLSLMQQLLSSD